MDTLDANNAPNFLKTALGIMAERLRQPFCGMSEEQRTTVAADMLKVADALTHHTAEASFPKGPRRSALVKTQEIARQMLGMLSSLQLTEHMGGATPEGLASVVMASEEMTRTLPSEEQIRGAEAVATEMERVPRFDAYRSDEDDSVLLLAPLNDAATAFMEEVEDVGHVEVLCVPDWKAAPKEEAPAP